MSSIFVPSTDNKESYTKLESDKKFERRDPDIVKTASTPSTYGQYLLYDDVKASYILGGGSSTSVKLGFDTAKNATGDRGVYLGFQCGMSSAGDDCISIGTNNSPNMEDFSIAVGLGNSSATLQRQNSILLGVGNQQSGINSIHIGASNATLLGGSCGDRTIMIGHQNATPGCGADSILIGTGCGRGVLFTDPCPGNIIHLNATGQATPIARNPSSCFIQPIRSVNFANTLTYNNTTGELGYVVSSQRYKKNIRDFTETSNIYNLVPKIYDFKTPEGIDPAPSQLNQLSFLAENVYENLPQCAYKNDDGQIENYSDRAIIACLVSELKKLRDRIDVLEANQLPEESPVLERS